MHASLVPEKVCSILRLKNNDETNKVRVISVLIEPRSAKKAKSLGFKGGLALCSTSNRHHCPSQWGELGEWPHRGKKERHAFVQLDG